MSNTPYLLFTGCFRVEQEVRSYKLHHFFGSDFAKIVSVSSMAYRMKRNGAGLASVCIIATMILVMISSSSCLYFGSEDAIMTRYPRETNITLHAQNPAQLEDDNLDIFRKGIADFAAERGVSSLLGLAAAASRACCSCWRWRRTRLISPCIRLTAFWAVKPP